MDTKWNDIDWEEKILSYLKALWRREEKWLLLCLAAYASSFQSIERLKIFVPDTLPMLALKISLSFTLGGLGLLNFAMVRMERRQGTQSGQFFQEWTHKQKRMRLLLNLIGATLSVFALILFLIILAHNEGLAIYSKNYIRLKTFCTGYLLAGAVLLQWTAGRLAIDRRLKKEASLHMEQMDEINQKSLEAAIRSEKMKVDLISNVSHDLKTPLTSMVGYIELMKKEELDGVMADYVEVVSNRAQKLKEMIDSLFDLAKTSSGNVELHFENLEMNRLIEQVMADMAEQIAKSGRETVVCLTPEPTDFTADSIYMYRIIQNLIENALKYSQENTRIFLKTSIAGWQKLGEFQQEEERKVRFEITNTSSYHMDFTNDQIVERFARGEESRTTEGNGLGLAIVNTYTAALGGQFHVALDCDQFKAIVEFPPSGQNPQ